VRASLSTLLIAATVAPLVVAPHTTAASKVGDDCTFGGKKLHGRVKIVDAFPDFEVRVVTAFPDLRVKLVDAFPDECGRWKLVDAFPDFTIKLVDAFPDFEIEYVDAFPGKP
jgi:hypothetical protein